MKKAYEKQTILFEKNIKFKWHGIDYYVDTSGVYCDGKLVPEADPFTFEKLAWGYSKDKNFVFYDYCNSKKVPGADPSTIEVLEYATIKDRYRVYHQYNLGEIAPVENINVRSFKVFNNGYFIDSFYLYGIDLDILLRLDSVDINGYFKLK